MTNEQEPAARGDNLWLYDELAQKLYRVWGGAGGDLSCRAAAMRAALPPLVLASEANASTMDLRMALGAEGFEAAIVAARRVVFERDTLRARVADLERERLAVCDALRLLARDENGEILNHPETEDVTEAIHKLTAKRPQPPAPDSAPVAVPDARWLWSNGVPRVVRNPSVDEAVALREALRGTAPHGYQPSASDDAVAHRIACDFLRDLMPPPGSFGVAAPAPAREPEPVDWIAYERDMARQLVEEAMRASDAFTIESKWEVAARFTSIARERAAARRRVEGEEAGK